MSVLCYSGELRTKTAKACATSVVIENTVFRPRTAEYYTGGHPREGAQKS